MKTIPGRALAAYTAAALHGRAEAASDSEGANPPSFADLVRNELAATRDALRRSEATAVAGLTGAASTQEVVEAVSAAELSLQKVVAVRDRILAAYQEIVRMPV